MKRRWKRSRSCALLALLLAACCGQRPAVRSGTSAQPKLPDAAPDAPPKPRLVVCVIIDQLGSGTLLRLQPLLAPDGLFAHALREGRVYEQVVYSYAATLTAPGHAAIHSGAVPAQSGVTSNYTIDRSSGKRRAVVDDGTHAVLHVPGKFAGPGVMRVDTVADTLEASTNGRAKVVSLSLKDRSAVLPAGKRPDLVLWYDAAFRGFTTSTYYAQELPLWLVDHQRAHPVGAEGVIWNAADPAQLAELLGPDLASGEGAFKGLDTTFPHALASSSDPYETWVLTPASTDALLALALESALQLGLGQDEVTDLLAISISGTDYAGHVFGPHSWEYADHLRHVDRALMRLLEQLQRQTSVAMLVTSDHGAAPLPERTLAAHPNAARLPTAALVDRLERAVSAAVGPGDWVSGFVDSYIVLTPEARGHAEQARIRAAVLAALRVEQGVLLARDVASAGAAPPAGTLEQAVQRSLHPDTSGDFFVVTSEYVIPDIGMTPGAGTTHGSPWPYDTHVPVLLVAPGVTPARHREALEQSRVASTLAALAGAPPPLADAPPPLPGVASQR